jgi:hypothetical protein
MPATVVINEWNDDGSSPTGVATSKGSSGGTIRFKNADNATVDTNDPLVVPASGSPSLFEYSYEKWIKLEITGGTYTQVDNIQAYSDGSNGAGTGVNIWYAIGTQFVAPSIPSESASPPQFGGTSMTDFFSSSSGSRIDMDAGDPGPHTTDGHIGDFLVMVMGVEGTASAGTTTAETLTITYDEI